MDRTIPKGAAILLEFIYETETGRSPPECYDVIYAHKQHKLARPLTQMTVGQVLDAQKDWSRNHGSSAAGAPQFIRKTLLGLCEELGIRRSQQFSSDLQDRLAYHLLKRRGYEDFMAGTMSREEFGKRLAMEWASLPVLASTRGSTRQLGRGQSYYAGDGLNKALVDPVEFEMVLSLVKSAGNDPQSIGNGPPSSTGRAGIVAAILAAMVAAAAWLADLPCNLFNTFCGG